jgi:transposase
LIRHAVAAGEAAASARRGREDIPVRVMFMDEARFGRISEVRRCWAPAGVRPVAFAQVEREYSYAFAALSPFDGELVSLLLPWTNTEMMSLFLGEASRRYPNEQVVMIMDQAGWHKAKRLNIPDNITLQWLPPYSPELNPVEHLWDDIREKWFSNRVFKTLNAVELQLLKALQHYLSSPSELSSLTVFPWMKLEY